MNDTKFQKWIKAVENKLKHEPGFTDDYTGPVHINVTQGGVNAVVLEKHLPVANTEKKKIV